MLIIKSFQEGIFPAQLKIAKVIALYKSGKQNDPNNYRPISLLNTISKVFEKVAASQVTEYFNSHITNLQFGFGNQTETIDGIINILANISSTPKSRTRGLEKSLRLC